MTKPNYEVNCDPKTGVCTAKLKIARGRAYDIPSERRSAEIEQRLNGAEYLGFGMDVQVKGVDSATRTVHFLASNATKDRYGDTIQPSGWDMKSYLRNPVILFGHDSRSLPIGRAPKTFVDKDGLHSFAQFATADIYPFADTVYRMVSGGFVSAMSVGFMPLEYEFIIEPKEEGDDSPYPNISGRNYTKQELLENSVVSIPANPEALVVGRGFEEAFRAITVETEVAPAEQPFEFEKGERAFFSIADGVIVNHGSNNPSDTKEADSDPFILVGVIGAEPVRSSATNSDRAVADFLAYTKGVADGFVCELVGATDEGNPVYRSLFQIHKKETASETAMCDTCRNSHGAAPCATCSKSVVPYHAYPLAPTGEDWDASKEMGSTDKPAEWKKMSTIILDDGSKKANYKLPHHKGPDGGYKTVRRGVANALARCGQVKGASASDKAGAKKHLLKHMGQFKKDFDQAAFTRDFELIESFRDASSCPEEITAKLTDSIDNFLVGEKATSVDETLLFYARAFHKAESPAVRDEICVGFAKGFPIQAKTVSTETANKKLARAQKSVRAAKDEMDECYKDHAATLQECSVTLDVIVSGGGLKDASAEDVATQLSAVHEKATEAHREMKRSDVRRKTHMATGIKCLKDMCDYMGAKADDEPDDDPDPDDPDADENPYPAEDDLENPPAGGSDADTDKLFEEIVAAAKATPSVEDPSLEDALSAIAK